MKIGILHVNSSSAASTSPTMRICRFIAAETEGFFIHDSKSAALARNIQFDVLFAKYGMLKFSDHREDALRIHDRAKFVVNVENDYTFVADRRFRSADETWSTVEKRTRYVNWNILTRRPVDEWKIQYSLPEPEMQGIVYYGAHREGRVPYFRKYFHNAPYPVTISSFRGGKKFRDTCGSGPALINAFRDPDAPARWPMTIYAEDEASHDLYCSPANRFYECVQMGLAQAVDMSAANTLMRAGVSNVDRYVVDSQQELHSLLKQWRMVRDEQMSFWFRDYSVDIRKQFAAAMKELLR